MHENCRLESRQALHDAAPYWAETHNAHRLSEKIGAERNRPRSPAHGLLALAEPAPEREHQADGLVGDGGIVSTRGDRCHAPEIANRSHVHAVVSDSSSGYDLKFRQIAQQLPCYTGMADDPAGGALQPLQQYFRGNVAIRLAGMEFRNDHIAAVRAQIRYRLRIEESLRDNDFACFGTAHF